MQFVPISYDSGGIGPFSATFWPLNGVIVKEIIASIESKILNLWVPIYFCYNLILFLLTLIIRNLL